MQKVKRKVTKEEIEYIRQHCLTKTDEQLSKDLNRDIKTIISYRKKLGIIKGDRGSIKSVISTDKSKSLQPSQRLTEDQRKEFFKTQLTNSLYYQNLKQQFSKEEIDFYLEEWSSLCIQFEDVVATEKRQIDELIKAEVMGNRILRNIMITENEINKVIERVDALRRSVDIDNDPVAQEQDMELQIMIKLMSSQSQAMSNDYQKNVNMRNELLNNLNARRRDRIDQLVKKGTSFLSIVEMLRDKEVKDAQGKHVELVRLAKEKKKSEWRNPKTFLDGTKDCVLLDDNSVLPVADRAEREEDTVKLDMNGKNILVLDNDIERIAFFKGKLEDKNKLICASTVEKAIDYIRNNTFDYVFLDYDLSFGEKSTPVAQFVADNLSPSNIKVVIHSMNSTGAEVIRSILDMKDFNVNVINFVELKNA